VAADALSSTLDQNQLRIAVAGPAPERVPVLINTTFHPNWHRADGGAVYATTPFAMLTFIDRQTELRFARNRIDQIALLISAGALVALCGFVAWPQRQRLFAILPAAFTPRFARWTTRKFIGD
jgi:hypothetical protein